MRFDGAQWQAVGGPFYEHPYRWVPNISLALDGSGTPYVAFNDQEGGSQFCGPATVMRFDGAGWQAVGGPVSEEGGCFTSLALDSAGNPWVAYEDQANWNRAAVKRFDGANWVGVGDGGFQQDTEETGFVRLALDASNKPLRGLYRLGDRLEGDDDDARHRRKLGACGFRRRLLRRRVA
jgi:hypothetical protein